MFKLIKEIINRYKKYPALVQQYDDQIRHNLELNNELDQVIELVGFVRAEKVSPYKALAYCLMGKPEPEEYSLTTLQTFREQLEGKTRCLEKANEKIKLQDERIGELLKDNLFKKREIEKLKQNVAKD